MDYSWGITRKGYLWTPHRHIRASMHANTYTWTYRNNRKRERIKKYIESEPWARQQRKSPLMEEQLHPLFPKSLSERAVMVAITEEGATLSAEGRVLEKKELPCILIFLLWPLLSTLSRVILLNLVRDLLGLKTHPPSDIPWLSLGYPHLMKGPWSYYLWVHWMFLSS